MSYHHQGKSYQYVRNINTQHTQCKLKGTHRPWQSGLFMYIQVTDKNTSILVSVLITCFSWDNVKINFEKKRFWRTTCAHGTVTPTLLPVNVLDIRNMGNNWNLNHFVSIRNLHIHLYFLATKFCLCGIYRQLNSILYPSNHLPKWAKMGQNNIESLKIYSSCRQFESR